MEENGERVHLQNKIAENHQGENKEKKKNQSQKEERKGKSKH